MFNAGASTWDVSQVRNRRVMSPKASAVYTGISLHMQSEASKGRRLRSRFQRTMSWRQTVMCLGKAWHGSVQRTNKTTVDIHMYYRTPVGSAVCTAGPLAPLAVSLSLLTRSSLAGPVLVCSWCSPSCWVCLGVLLVFFPRAVFVCACSWFLSTRFGLSSRSCVTVLGS